MLKVLRDKWSVRQDGIILLSIRVLLCLAGAGAGKTAVLTERVAYFIRRGFVAAENVYLVTFSRKAASMLNARIRMAAGVDVHASTIHSLAREVLLSSVSWGYVRPEVLDERAQIRILEQSLVNHSARNTLEPRRVASQISWWKAHGFSAPEIIRLYPSDPQAQAFYIYENSKGDSLDFCDLITRAANVLESDNNVRALWHERVKYLAVDELQDTNALELRFLKLLAPPDAFIFAVGDPDQAIYQFQGADISNCLNFDRFFAGATVLTLTENRRSTATILSCAQSLIEHNAGRYPKVLTPVRTSGAPVSIVEALDSKEEQEYVAAQIQIALLEGVPPGEIAVLARTRSIVDSYAAFLKGRGHEIAHHLYDKHFWARPVIERAVAVVAVVAGTASTRDWNHVLAHLPQADQIAILRETQRQNCEIQSLADSGSLVQSAITKSGQDKMARLLGAVAQLRLLPLNEIGNEITQLRRSLGFLDGQGACASQNLLNDLEFFSGAVADFARQPNVINLKSLHSCLSSSVVSDGKMSVLTAHTTKGLEYSRVFVVGCEEGLFPHYFATDTNLEAMEEERRLFFVAMTRAKDHLFLLHSRKRWSGKTQYKKCPSRFLSEIGTAGVERIDVTTFLKGRISCTSPSTSTAR